MKLVEIKKIFKRQAPVIASSTIAIIATSLATYYRNKLDESDPRSNVIEVDPELMREVREKGAVLKYKVEGNNEYFTTLADFPLGTPGASH